MARLLDDSGPVKTLAHYVEHSDQLIIERVQDVEPVLDANAVLRAAQPDGYASRARELRHVAEVPLVVLEQWANQQGIGLDVLLRDDGLLRRFLNDPANRFLRIGGGRI